MRSRARSQEQEPLNLPLHEELLGEPSPRADAHAMGTSRTVSPEPVPGGQKSGHAKSRSPVPPRQRPRRSTPPTMTYPSNLLIGAHKEAALLLRFAALNCHTGPRLPRRPYPGLHVGSVLREQGTAADEERRGARKEGGGGGGGGRLQASIPRHRLMEPATMGCRILTLHSSCRLMLRRAVAHSGSDFRLCGPCTVLVVA